MPVGKKLVVVASVLVIGTTAAFFFRKDASPFRFWNSGPEDPFEKPVERRVGGVVTQPQQALRVPASATAAISEPRGLASNEPSYQRNLNPVGSLLPPIEGVVDDAETFDPAENANTARAPVTAPGGAWRHTVVDGDTLSKLAAHYLGRADAYLTIYELNRDVLASPDLLPIGAVLKIPPPVASVAGPISPDTSSHQTERLELVPVSGRTNGALSDN